MADPEHLAKAPIVEAVLDIQATLPNSVTIDDLASIQAKLRDYPDKQIRNAWTAQLSFRPDGSAVVPSSVGGAIGYMFRTADGKQVAQVRKDGFTFSRLRPYQSWDTMRDEAHRVWDIYLSIARPEKVTRIALRYINRLQLPLPFRDFREYILTAPEIAPGLPQALSELFFRVVLPDPEIQAMAIITEAIDQESSNKNSLPLIFDIDVFKTGAMPTQIERLWPLFEDLRAFKNRVFFSSLTPQALELCR